MMTMSRSNTVEQIIDPESDSGTHEEEGELEDNGKDKDELVDTVDR